MKHLQINQIKVNHNLLILYNQDKYLNNKNHSNRHNINNHNNRYNQILKLIKVVINHQLQQTFSILVYQVQIQKL